MGGESWGSLIYLVLLGSALIAIFFANNQLSFNKILQQAAIWGLIFLAFIAAYGLWEDIQGSVRPTTSISAQGDEIVVPRSRDGHFHLTLDVNGAPINFMVDTGASLMVLRQADAERAGVDMSRLIYSGRASTANGVVRTAPVWLKEVSLGGITETDVRASVNEGELHQSLLGMSYLQHFAKIEMTNDSLVLHR